LRNEIMAVPLHEKHLVCPRRSLYGNGLCQLRVGQHRILELAEMFREAVEALEAFHLKLLAVHQQIPALLEVPGKTT
jgi:hypothetical protein